MCIPNMADRCRSPRASGRFHNECGLGICIRRQFQYMRVRTCIDRLRHDWNENPSLKSTEALLQYCSPRPHLPHPDMSTASLYAQSHSSWSHRWRLPPYPKCISTSYRISVPSIATVMLVTTKSHHSPATAPLGFRLLRLGRPASPGEPGRWRPVDRDLQMGPNGAAVVHDIFHLSSAC